MTTAVQMQLRRDTAANVAAFTGAQGECVVDTTNDRIVVNDGSTAGGWAAAKLAETITNTYVTVNDAGYTALVTDRTIAYIALTAARTVALLAASSYPKGTRLLILDTSGSCSATNTITVSPNGSDTIKGASAVISSAYGYLSLESNGSGQWTAVDRSSGGRVLLNTITASSSSSLSDTTSLTAAFPTYEIEFVNLLPTSTTGGLVAQLQVHSGGSYQTTGYYWVGSGAYGPGTGVNAGVASGGSGIALWENAGHLSNTAPGIVGTLTVRKPNDTTAPKIFEGELAYPAVGGGGAVGKVMGAWAGGNGAVDGFELTIGSSTWLSGQVRIWGKP
jgi:hypothetical protein